MQGKQSTSWVATYDKNYVVIMMITQGGTGSGTSGPAVRKIWESLYGIKGEKVDPKDSVIPGTTPPDGAADASPRTARSCRRRAAGSGGGAMTLLSSGPTSTQARRPVGARRSRASLDWVLLGATLAVLLIGSVLVWSATSGNRALDRRPPLGVPAQAPGQHRDRAGARQHW